MTTEYRVRLDRGACEGVFACLVRDDRFVEAADGLATIEASEGLAAADGGSRSGGDCGPNEHDELVVPFADDRVEAAKQAARACPVDAIEVLTEGDDE
ncbi:ferredoxin [Halobellus litoreus]|uniref:Ferredoxin n=1 Tax=Halobellus litoreus TaxID=755310 RepID=A0ABD6DTS7_9EURY|nr:ferredoxin [Halobellus litoreus]